MTKLRVIIESPYAGDIERNTTYARRAVKDSLLRGEAPIASHLLYTQPDILDEHSLDERLLGIEAGLTWLPAADLMAVYQDYGISPGMSEAVYKARSIGLYVEFRQIES